MGVVDCRAEHFASQRLHRPCGRTEPGVGARVPSPGLPAKPLLHRWRRYGVPGSLYGMKQDCFSSSHCRCSISYRPLQLFLCDLLCDRNHHILAHLTRNTLGPLCATGDPFGPSSVAAEVHDSSQRPSHLHCRFPRPKTRGVLAAGPQACDCHF